jgi:hypothetical protein
MFSTKNRRWYVMPRNANSAWASKYTVVGSVKNRYVSVRKRSVGDVCASGKRYRHSAGYRQQVKNNAGISFLSAAGLRDGLMD